MGSKDRDLRARKESELTLLMKGLNTFHYLCMVILFVIAWDFFYGRVNPTMGEDTYRMAVCTVYALFLLVISKLYRGYKVGHLRVGEIVYSQILANLVSLGMCYVCAMVFASTFLNPLGGIVVFLVQSVWSVLWTLVSNAIYFSIHKARKAIVIYHSEEDLRKLTEIRHLEKRWKIEQYVCCIMGEEEKSRTSSYGLNLPENHEELRFHVREDLLRMLDKYEAVFVAGIKGEYRDEIMAHCIDSGIQCFYVPGVSDIWVMGGSHVRSLSVPICMVQRKNLPFEYLFVKRSFDIVLSLLSILIFSPVMLLVSLMIYLYDRGPVFYRQVRLTKNGKRFHILKFRSMKVDAEKDGVARLCSQGDSRITPVGRFIRAVRFDELPQFFNILKGDMSFVGPRPERPEIQEQYEKSLPTFGMRLQVKAGLTGYAQVYGRYNTEPKDKLKMDLMYVNHAGIVEDLKLIFATFKILFMKESTEGIAENQITAERECPVAAKETPSCCKSLRRG